MKRAFTILFTLLFSLSMCACGTSAAEKQYLSFSKALSEAQSLSFDAELRAEYENKTARFKLRYNEDASGALVTVLAPELIAGVSAHIEKGSTTLNYDSLVLDTGLLDPLGLSPMSALPLIVEAMKSGYVMNVSREREVLVVELCPEDTYRCTLRLSSADMKPLSAQLASGERVTVYADFSGWQTG